MKPTTAFFGIVTDKVWLLDFAQPDNNDWLVVNQFTVIENHVNRRPDVVVFINGMPLAVIELKNPADHQATVRTAYNQFQTYKAQIPSLFTCNEVLIISDGHEAKIGSLSANWERFPPRKPLAQEASRSPTLKIHPRWESFDADADRWSK